MPIYLSSFSDSTKDGKTNVYCPSKSRWYNLNDSSIYFNINTTSPQSAILNKGLSMKNMIMIGPPSEYLAADTINYELAPFTVFFYAALAQPVFADDADEITIFRMYAETPNSVRLLMRQSPKPNCTQIQLILGSVKYRYSWDIITSTLISNGNDCLYAVTFDTDLTSKDKVITLYIGKSQYVADITEQFTDPIKLSNSHMEINSSGKLDAILYSFGFIQHKLTSTELDTISNYMYQERTGSARELAAAKTSLQSDLNTKLVEASQKLSDATAACTNEVPSKPEKKVNKWNIMVPSAETAVATDTDLYTGLKIKEATTPSPAPPAPSTASSSAPPAPAPSPPAPAPAYKNNDYNISYPADVSSTNVTQTDLVVNPVVYQNTTSVSKTYTPPPATEQVDASTSTSTSSSASMLAPISESKTNLFNSVAPSGNTIEPPYYDTNYYNKGDPMALDASFSML
jgi:hypothetical protein